MTALGRSATLVGIWPMRLLPNRLALSFAAALGVSAAPSVAHAQAASVFPPQRRSVAPRLEFLLRIDTVRTGVDSGSVRTHTDTITQAPTTSPGPQFSVPLGAGAGTGANSGSAATAAASLGAQVWQPDQYLVNGFFNYAGDSRVTGTAKDFGSAVLNPNLTGHSVSFAGQRTLFPIGNTVQLSVVGEVAAAGTLWQPDTTKPGTNGWVLGGSAGLQVASRSGTYSQDNTYQFGGELAYAWRGLAGDLSQNASAALRADPGVLGVSKTSFGGEQLTLFLRLNSVMPFVRITHFASPVDVAGLSGTQVFVGIRALSPVFQTPNQ